MKFNDAVLVDSRCLAPTYVLSYIKGFDKKKKKKKDEVNRVKADRKEPRSNKIMKSFGLWCAPRLGAWAAFVLMEKRKIINIDSTGAGDTMCCRIINSKLPLLKTSQYTLT